MKIDHPAAKDQMVPAPMFTRKVQQKQPPELEMKDHLLCEQPFQTLLVVGDKTISLIAVGYVLNTIQKGREIFQCVNNQAFSDMHKTIRLAAEI